MQVDRPLFVALGLYAPTYSPAWYDDTDAAFAIRKAGYTVYFTPFAEVANHPLSIPHYPPFFDFSPSPPLSAASVLFGFLLGCLVCF